MMPGTPERITHDYIRAGTVDLFAALEVAGPTAGRVITQLHPRHRATEFRKFLVTIDKNVPTGYDVHLILDNYAHPQAPSRSRSGCSDTPPASTCTSPPPRRPGSTSSNAGSPS